MKSQKLPSKYFYLRNYIIAKKLATPAKLITTKFTEKSRVLRKLNSENNLIKNWNVLEVLQTYNEDIKNVSLQAKKTSSVMHFLTQSNIIKYTPIYLSLTKEFILLEWEKKRQFFFFFNELLHSLDQSNKTLLKEMSFFFDKKTAYLKEKAEISLFENYLHSLFYLKNHKLSYGVNIPSVLFLKITQNLLISHSTILIIQRILNSKSNILNLGVKENILDLFSFWNVESQRWELYGLPNNEVLNLAENKTLDLILKQNKVISLIRRRTTRILKSNLRLTTLGLKNSAFNLKSFVWKTNTHFTTNNFFTSVAKISRLYNKEYNFSNKKTSFQILYLISRIEEKILNYTGLAVKSATLTKLIRLRNLLLYLIQEKKLRVMSQQALLTTKAAIIKVRTKTWKIKLLTYLQNELEKTNIEKNSLFFNFVNIIHNRLLLGRKTSSVKLNNELNNNLITARKPRNFIFGTNLGENKFFRSNIRKSGVISKVKSWNNKMLNVKRNWVGSKLILAEKSLTFVQKKAILSSWINRPVDLFFINALSLTKFAFKNERVNSPNNNPNTFLSVLDRDLINKYKYIGIYIKDLVRVAFISVFFKKPSFLAKFMAFQLSKLPRNRKETNFIRFLIKVIKTFAAERKEILGIRIRFKGRVNRWRRTKFILGNRGTLPLQTIVERIEQGTAQAINKKGAVGIRIWLRYKESFSVVLKDHILKYLNYSKVLKLRKINKTLLLK